MMKRSPLLALFALPLLHCSAEVAVTTPPIPVANDENCKFENLKAIHDESVRQQLAGLCLRRGLDANYQPQPGKKW